MPHTWYDLGMMDAPALVSNLPLSSEPVSGRLLSPLVPFSSSGRSETETRCLWCGRTFRPRVTGGSAQKFCCPGHRNAFWTAARRWTLRAIETGLLSVECLKAIETSVHAPGEAIRARGGVSPPPC